MKWCIIIADFFLYQKVFFLIMKVSLKVKPKFSNFAGIINFEGNV